MMPHSFRRIAPLIALLLAGCTGDPPDQAPAATTLVQPFGTMPDGRTAQLFTLVNDSGAEMKVTNYGGIIVSLSMPDRDGNLADIVLGHETLPEYNAETPYFGALVGRYGNRIADGRFTLDGETVELAANDGDNHLHGGLVGFDKVLWDAEPFENEDGMGLRLSYLSPDGDEGYPGNLAVVVKYLLAHDNRLVISYEATTDQATPVNLTHHSYFNLAGADGSSILDHELMIAASQITPVGAGLIPTGDLSPVDDTPFDFRTPTPIGARIEADDDQLALGGGYDHNWVLDGEPGTMRLAASVHEPTTGRIMEVYTIEPGLQFYSGNFLDGSLTGKGGAVYAHRSGFCLETQHFPDSPNQPDFPSTILHPGEIYSTATAYVFKTDSDE